MITFKGAGGTHWCPAAPPAAQAESAIQNHALYHIRRPSTTRPESYTGCIIIRLYKSRKRRGRLPPQPGHHMQLVRRFTGKPHRRPMLQPGGINLPACTTCSNLSNLWAYTLPACTTCNNLGSYPPCLHAQHAPTWGHKPPACMHNMQ